MAECVQCGDRYLMEDVEAGTFFPSSSVCLTCYKKMHKSSSSCFGDKDKYGVSKLPCQECGDNRICRSFIFHKKEFYRKEV
jgi:hypothetical protein